MLQVFDLYSDKVLDEIEVVSYNRVSRTETERITPPWILHYAFSCDGQRLVTIDRRTGEGGALRTALKFWVYSYARKAYTLATCVDSPHGEEEITGLVYHPTEDSALTASADGTFKLWSTDANGADRKVLQSTGTREVRIDIGIPHSMYLMHRALHFLSLIVVLLFTVYA